jgi:hypothetical protein
VIQIQIPSEPPASFFSSSEDGPGWAVVMFFKITEVCCQCLVDFIGLQFNYVFFVRLLSFLLKDACRQLKDLSTASPAVKLFANWCEKAETDALWRGRFKVRVVFQIHVNY